MPPAQNLGERLDAPGHFHLRADELANPRLDLVGARGLLVRFQRAIFAGAPSADRKRKQQHERDSADGEKNFRDGHGPRAEHEENVGHGSLLA